MLKQFEETYDCAGICYTPLFYLTKSVETGKVTQTCDKAIIDDLSGNMAGAVVAGITGLALLIGAIGAFPLCSGFDKDE